MFIIAEIGQAHEGSLGIAHSYIDALANKGVDAIKWQTHIADAESSREEPFRVMFSYEDASRMDYWKRMEFTPEQWQGLKQHCEEKGMEFISSPFSNAAVDLLEELGVNRYKIGSGEVSNFLMLQKIGQTGKPIILSSGMSTFKELEASINFLKPFGVDLSLMQCTTSYPTEPEQWGLNVLNELRDEFSLPVGFSDHSGDIYACLAATALGADFLEFHVVFDKRMFGPDSKSSIQLDQVEMLTKGARQIRISQHNQVDKSVNSQFEGLKNIFEKSLSVNKNLPAGHILELNDLEAKKPKNMGIPSSLFPSVLGKRLSVDKVAWSFLKEQDLDE